MSTCPCMSKVTPSLSSSDRWTSGPPNTSSGDSSPVALTTRWHGSLNPAGAARIAQPTGRAAPGLPRPRAMAPYVVTFPRGTFAATLQTRSKRVSADLMWLLPDRWRLPPPHEAATTEPTHVVTTGRTLRWFRSACHGWCGWWRAGATPAHHAAAHPGHWRLNMGRTDTAPLALTD